MLAKLVKGTNNVFMSNELGVNSVIIIKDSSTGRWISNIGYSSTITPKIAKRAASVINKLMKDVDKLNKLVQKESNND